MNVPVLIASGCMAHMLDYFVDFLIYSEQITLSTPQSHDQLLLCPISLLESEHLCSIKINYFKSNSFKSLISSNNNGIFAETCHMKNKHK